MLFEHRCYTLRHGCEEAFWDLQRERGFAPVRPILERLVGYFRTESGPSDQAVHLYRFDSYEDWVTRLHGLYAVDALQPYFTKVRQLMTAQENRFLAIAPLPGLNPLWGAGLDWLPGVPIPSGFPQGSVVEETVTQLLPGALPSYWSAYERSGLIGEPQSDRSLVACFYTLVGRFHQVVHYRCYSDVLERHQQRSLLRSSGPWLQFANTVRPLVLAEEAKLLEPAHEAELSPLFRSRPG